MKSIEVIVPRMLVRKHYPHPELEPYGESIVELINGMVTDVFTDEDGHLFTITNEKELIKYLRHNSIEDEIINLRLEKTTLQTVTIKNLALILNWKNLTTNYSYNSEKYSEEMILKHISHANTRFSNLFLIEHNSLDVGLFGYTVNDRQAIINLEIYEKELIDESGIDIAIPLMINYLKEKYRVKTLLTNFFKDDNYSKEIFDRNGFSVDLNNELEIPVSMHKSKIAVTYKLELY